MIPAQDEENTEIVAAEPQKLSNDEVLLHTASLWKYQPIPDASVEPNPMPEIYALHQDTKEGPIWGARVRGKKHKHEGTNSDDWFAVDAIDRIRITAVADGAGSKHFSRIGAHDAAETAVSFLRMQLTDLLSQYDKPEELYTAAGITPEEGGISPVVHSLAQAVQKAMQEAYRAVRIAFLLRMREKRYADVLGRPLRLTDFSSTLLVVLWIPCGEPGPGKRDSIAISCQVGDGAIAAINAGAAFEDGEHLLCQADSGDFSGETEFLTSQGKTDMESLQSRTRIYCGPITHILVMTDGVSDDYYPAETEMRRLYCDLLVNNVLPLYGIAAEDNSYSLDEIRSIRGLGKPIAFPWPNDKSISVALHYMRRLCGKPEDLAHFWEEPRKLRLASAAVDIPDDIPVEQRMAKWLDNYVERSSFDDRTLVVMMESEP